MKKILLCTLLISLSFAVSAQRTIVGAVKNTDAESLIGATVMLKNTQKGIQTDENGIFTLANVQETDSLVFSFVGHTPQTIAAKNFSEKPIVLEKGILMDEFEVVAYVGCRGFCCPGSVVFLNHDLSITREDFLKVIPLSISVTKLDFGIERIFRDLWLEMPDTMSVIYYEIYKSTDDEHYTLIGKTTSTNVVRSEKTNGQWHLIWGETSFLDRDKQKTPITYYDVIGYYIHEKTGEKIEIYHKKASIENAKILTINTLYYDVESHQLDLNVSSPLDAKTDFLVVDMSGRIILQQKIPLISDKNMLSIPTEKLLSGTYILHLSQGVQKDIRKFTVVR